MRLGIRPRATQQRYRQIAMRLALTLVPLALAGCGALRSPTIATTATVQPVTSGCELVIEGLFPNMAHDPITLVFSGRSKVVARAHVPSLTGSFDGDQVRVKYQGESGEPWGGCSPLVGTVVFQANRVHISLVHVIEGRKPDQMLFNGSYSLIGASSCLGGGA
jgi:hypothetical protein